jgi:hypothetical protein
MKEFGFDIFIYLVTGFLVIAVIFICILLPISVLVFAGYTMYQAVGLWSILIWAGILVIPTLIGWAIVGRNKK